MEQVMFNGKDVNTMTSTKLLHALQTTLNYQKMTQKAIVNQIGSKSVYALHNINQLKIN
jgi:hypothetical protein